MASSYGSPQYQRGSPDTVICSISFLLAASMSFCGLTLFAEGYNYFLSLATLCLSSAIHKTQLPQKTSEFTLRASLLGHLCGVGAFATACGGTLLPFGLYVVLLANFHWSEYLFISLFSPHSLSKKSFMLNHSPAYVVATVASWTEFFVRNMLGRDLPKLNFLTWIGFGLCIAGEVARKAAIVTAGRSFSHIIEENKRAEHVLVTHGIYRFCRHPSYLGWWLFAVGTQVLLHNPFCTLGFFYGAYRFFVARVPFEEETLVEFFGDEYITYRRSVPLLLPFIRDSAKDD